MKIQAYLNPKLPISERVKDLLSKMTLQEKVGQVNQHLYGWQCYQKANSGSFTLTDYLKKHVAWGGGMGALYGVLRADPWSKVDYSNGIDVYNGQKITNQIQKYVLEHSRLHIPVMFVEECPHGHQGLDSPSFPTNIGKGNSFDSELITKMAHSQAEELRAQGINLALVSTLDLALDPRWGRTEECFGEDPHLSAEFSEAIVRGFQGNIINDRESYIDSPTTDDKHVGVVLKHFLAQGQTLGGHNSGSVAIGQNDFAKTYGELIHSCRNAAGIMAAYNDIDGIPCHVNQNLLTKLLRDNNGFQGIVMADGTALDRLTDYFPTDATAIKASMAAGVDLSLWDNLYLQIADACQIDTSILQLLDRSVSRVLSLKFLLGLFDHPYTSVTRTEIQAILAKEQELNLELAHESITLIKNNHALPLDTKKEIAVIGPNADSVYNLLGDYTAPQSEEMKHNTIFQVLKDKITNVKLAQGCEIRSTKESTKMIDEAKGLADQVDTIVLVLGGSSGRSFNMEFLRNGAVSSKGINMDCGENVDVASLKLGGSQLELLQRMKASGKKLVTILVEGRPYDIRKVLALSDAVLIAWYPGIMGASAIVDVLLGKFNPTGRLSISYPRSSNQLPVYYYQRAAAKNKDYYDLPGDPLLPFGFGLHYGSINVQDIAVSFVGMNKAKISLFLTNESLLPVKESILTFAQYQIAGEIPQAWRLCNFQKVFLSAGESKKLNFEVTFAPSVHQIIYQAQIKVCDRVFTKNIKEF